MKEAKGAVTFYNISHLTGKIVFNKKCFGLLVFKNETVGDRNCSVTSLVLTLLTSSFLLPGLPLSTHSATDNSQTTGNYI